MDFGRVSDDPPWIRTCEIGRNGIVEVDFIGRNRAEVRFPAPPACAKTACSLWAGGLASWYRTMPETFNPQSQEQVPEGPSKQERLADLYKAFDEAEKALIVEEKENANEARENAKAYLPRIYDDLIALNKRDKGSGNEWAWNPEGDLTEQEFDSLNLRRKLLSNAIGIMTASGDIRHDLNEI